jgi:hypothetical protein
MGKIEMGIISSDGEMKRWRDIGKNVTVYSDIVVPTIGLKTTPFDGKIFIDGKNLYLCWGSYTTRLRTLDDSPVRIKMVNNSLFTCTFLVKGETYLGKIQPLLQLVIDDEHDVMYMVRIDPADEKKYGTIKQLAQVYRTSGITWLTKGNTRLDKVIGNNKNDTSYTCVIKEGIPSFATDNKHKVVNTYKQGKFIFFHYNGTDKNSRISVIDTTNGDIYRFGNNASEVTSVGPKSVTRFIRYTIDDEQYNIRFDLNGIRFEHRGDNIEEQEPFELLDSVRETFKAGDPIFIP